MAVPVMMKSVERMKLMLEEGARRKEEGCEDSGVDCVEGERKLESGCFSEIYFWRGSEKVSEWVRKPHAYAAGENCWAGLNFEEDGW